MSAGQWAVIGCAGLGIGTLLGYEMYALLSKNPETKTISRYVWDASYAHPLIPALVCLGIGLLLGHFFWQSRQP